MSTIRDALGRFLPRFKHDPLAEYLILQEDGRAAYATGDAHEAYEMAAQVGATLVRTRANGRHSRVRVKVVI